MSPSEFKTSKSAQNKEKGITGAQLNFRITCLKNKQDVSNLQGKITRRAKTAESWAPNYKIADIFI